MYMYSTCFGTVLTEREGNKELKRPDVDREGERGKESLFFVFYC